MATEEEKTLTMVLTGKSGAGKSSLLDIFTKGKAIQKHSAGPVTDKFIDKEVKENGVTIKFIDTPGLMGKKTDSKELKMCSTYTKAEADLLVYCLSVAAGQKFRDTNPEIMQSLAEGFEKSIWEHCVLVLTMSNNAMHSFNEHYPANAETEYKKFLKKFTERFEKQLCSLGVEKCVKTVFDLEETDDITKMIIAIPAGKNSRSQILPGLEYWLPDYYEKNWISLLLELMRAKCTAESASLLLQYQYGEGRFATPGAIAGGIVGGVLLPVLGAAPGAVAGYKAGLAIGKRVTTKEKEYIKQELDKRQES